MSQRRAAILTPLFIRARQSFLVVELVVVDWREVIVLRLQRTIATEQQQPLPMMITIDQKNLT
jgi:hypothetical protein